MRPVSSLGPVLPLLFSVVLLHAVKYTHAYIHWRARSLIQSVSAAVGNQVDCMADRPLKVALRLRRPSCTCVPVSSMFVDLFSKRAYTYNTSYICASVLVFVVAFEKCGRPLSNTTHHVDGTKSKHSIKD